MKRASFYVSEEAAKALDDAAKLVLAKLGGGTPRHIVLSALLLAGAAQTEAVTRQLAAHEAAELTERLAALQQATE